MRQNHLLTQENFSEENSKSSSLPCMAGICRETSLTSSPVTHPLAHLYPLISLLFPEYKALEPLQVLFLLLKCSSLDVHWFLSFIFFGSLFQCYFLRRPTLTTLFHFCDPQHLSSFTDFFPVAPVMI